MGILLDFFNNQKTKLAKFLIKNKVFISAVVKYMSIAYEAGNGDKKMQEAIKFVLCLVKLPGMNLIADNYSDDIEQFIKTQVQNVYNEMKAKGYLS